MQIWSSEIKEVEKLYDSFKGNLPLLEKEVEQLIKTDDANVAMLYSRRSLEVIVTDLCEAELKRPRKTQPLKGIIDKLNYEEKVPSHIITSMDGLNSLSAFGAHPGDFDPEQVKPVINNLTTVIKWYLKYRDLQTTSFPAPDQGQLAFTPENPDKTQPILRHYPKKNIIWISLLAIAIITMVCLFAYEITKSPQTIKRTIAVLPFKNMSNYPEYSLLGDALTEEMIIQLWKVKQFEVLPINSVLNYKETIKKSRLIARELRVNYLVSGSIERFENRVIIRAWLIEGAKEKQLWTDQYNRNWEEFGSLQSEITKQIAAALQTGLTPDEVKKIEKQPTKSSDAYATLLSGNSLLNDARYYLQTGMRYNDSASLPNAIKAYDKAISYDTTYALAYAKRAISRSWSYYAGSPDQSNIIKCKEDIDEAIRLDADLTEAQIAMGFYYYYCLKDYTKALGCFQKAASKEPGNPEPLYYIAVAYRRLGDWEKSRYYMNTVLDKSINSALILTNIGLTYDYLRNYDSSLIYHQKAIRAMPGWRASYANLMETYLLRNGRTNEVRILLDTAIQRTGLRLLKKKIELDIYDNKYPEALQYLKESKLSDFNDRGELYLLYAQVHNSLKNNNNARAYYDSAKVFFNQKLAGDPENSITMSSLGIACAGLKERAKAMELGEKAVKLSENDMIVCLDRKTDLAKIYVMLEEYDKAMNQIEDLLKQPACISVKLMHLDPVWKPLVTRPDFQKMIAIKTLN
jgi:TolB-like protein/Flp pilus assembly protein TadD